MQRKGARDPPLVGLGVEPHLLSASSSLVAAVNRCCHTKQSQWDEDRRGVLRCAVLCCLLLPLCRCFCSRSTVSKEDMAAHHALFISSLRVRVSHGQPTAVGHYLPAPHINSGA